MEGIYSNCTLFPLHSPLNHKHQLQLQRNNNNNKLLWLSTNQPPNSLLPQKMRHTISPYPLRTNSFDDSSLVLAVTAQAKPRDLNVLFQTGSVLVFAYWIANFVVPNILSKDFPVERTDEDQRDIGSNPLQDKEESTSTQAESSTSTTLKTSSPGRKKKGYRSTKR